MPPKHFDQHAALPALATDNNVRVSNIDTQEEVVQKVALVTSDFKPGSEFWQPPPNCPRYRIRLARETPIALPASQAPQPNVVRRKNTLSCTYKDFRFDVSLVDQEGDRRLELEIECLSLEGGQELIQRHLVLKLTDLVQIAYGY